MSDAHYSSQHPDPGTSPEFQPESQVSSPVSDPRADTGEEQVIARVPDLERTRSSSRRGSNARWSEGRILNQRLSMRLLVGAGVVLVVLAIALPFLFRGIDGDSQGTDAQSTTQANAEGGSAETPGWEGSSTVPGGDNGTSEPSAGNPQDGFGGPGMEGGVDGFERTPPWSQGGSYPSPNPRYDDYPPPTGYVTGSGRTEGMRWDQSTQASDRPYQYRQGAGRTTSGNWDSADGFRPGSTGRVPPGLPTAEMNRPADIANGDYSESRSVNQQAAYYQHFEGPQATANRPASLTGRGDAPSYDYRRDYSGREYRGSGAAAPVYSRPSRPDNRAYESHNAPSNPSSRSYTSGQSGAYPRDYHMPGAAGEYPPSRATGYAESGPRSSYREPSYRGQPSRTYPTTGNSSGSLYGGPRYRSGGSAAATGEAGVARLEGIIQDPSERTSSYDSARSRNY